jgi:hypothetical protein
MPCERTRRQLATVSQENGRLVIVIADKSKYHHAKLHAAWRLERQGRFGLDHPATLQPRVKPDRARLETNPAKLSPQCRLPTVGLGYRIGRKTIRPLVETECRACSSFSSILSAINYGIKNSFCGD